jgi:hypothetical protein
VKKKNNLTAHLLQENKYLLKSKKYLQKQLEPSQIKLISEIAKDFGTGIGIAAYAMIVFDGNFAISKALIGLTSTLLTWYSSLALNKYLASQNESK